MEWTNPRYAELVAAYRTQQESPDPDVAPFGATVAADGEPAVARRGFVVGPLN